MKMKIQIGSELHDTEVALPLAVVSTDQTLTTPGLSEDQIALLRKAKVTEIISSVYGPASVAWRVASYHGRLSAQTKTLTSEEKNDLRLLNEGDKWQERVIAAGEDLYAEWPAPPEGLAALCGAC